MLLKQIEQGIKSLSQHRLRAFLSTLGVLFGVSAVITMLSIGEGAKLETLAQIEQLGMKSITVRQNDLSESQQKKTKEQRSEGLTLKDSLQLQKNVPGLQHIASLKTVKALVLAAFTRVNPEILAVSDAFSSIKGLETAEGRFLGALDIQRKTKTCVLGCEVAKSLGKYGHAGQTILIDNVPFQIVGVLKNKHWKSGKTSALTARNLNKNVFIPIGVESILPTFKSKDKDTLSEIIVQIKDSAYFNTASQVIKRILENSHKGVDDYQIIIPQELLNQAYRTQYTFNLVLGSIAAISLLVGGIGIMNIMLANVSERTREIGIRRAVGATKRHIITQFLTETLLLTFFGALLGILIGILFSIIISFTAGWTTVITWWSILLSLGMATLVGAASGLYPAVKAASMNPITALRHD